MVYWHIREESLPYIFPGKMAWMNKNIIVAKRSFESAVMMVNPGAMKL